MDSLTYWKDREDANRKANQLVDVEYVKEFAKIYQNMQSDIQTQIDAFWSKYAKKEGITLSDAKLRASEVDNEAFSNKAKKYVDTRDFSEKANDELKLYNLVMRVNRLELLKANIGLELISGYDEIQKKVEKALVERALNEFKRQAGILGQSVQNNTQLTHAIVNASFKDATFSDRIWMQQDALKGEINRLLQIGLIHGKSPKDLARELKRALDVSRVNAERIMRTELCRVQTEAAMQSYIKNRYDEYMFIAEMGKCCDICGSLDGKTFKVDEMEPSLNAPPMHPNCVTADTQIIAPDAEAIIKSEYLGNIVEIGTAHGRKLAVTSNHIVLTARGWVRAKNLIKGDKVVSYLGWDKFMRPSTRRNLTNYDSILTIEQLFTALSESSFMPSVTVPATTEHLKGDVVKDSKINIESINSSLRNKIDALIAKYINDFSIIDTMESSNSLFKSDCTLAQFLTGTGLASDSIMSGFDVANILFDGSFAHHELISIRRPSDYDARLNKSTTNYRPTDFEFFSDSFLASSSNAYSRESDSISFDNALNNRAIDIKNISDFISTFSCFVEFDDIVFINITYNSSCYMYDISSLSTLYIANGIISSNCRCSTTAHMSKDKTDNLLQESTKNDIMDIQNKDRLVGVERGNPMSIEDADTHNANPNFMGGNYDIARKFEEAKEKFDDTLDKFLDGLIHHTESNRVTDEYFRLLEEYDKICKENMQYDVNCQRCVPAYELRRRGYDVIAMPRNKDVSYEDAVLAPRNMWLDKDGNITQSSLLSAKNNKSVTKELNQNMKIGERGSLGWIWTGKEVAHIVAVEMTEDGLKIIDPQSGKIRDSFEGYMGKSTFMTEYESRDWGVEYHRLDDKYVDTSNLDIIVTGVKK